jgi:hypothetical protein
VLIPARHALLGHVPPARHLGLRHTLREQPGRLTTPALQRLKVTPLTNRPRCFRRLRSTAFGRHWLRRRPRHDIKYLSELHDCHSITRNSLRADDGATVDRWRVAVMGVFELVARHFAFDDPGLARGRRRASSWHRISAVTQVCASAMTSGGKTRVACGGSASCPE